MKLFTRLIGYALISFGSGVAITYGLHRPAGVLLLIGGAFLLASVIAPST
jgi:hypothetical protein